MIGYLRARGLWWALLTAIAAVLGAAWFAHWLEAKPQYGVLDRIPAIVLGSLAAAVLVAPGWQRVDDEVEGSTPRPRRSVELTITVGMVAVVGAVAAIVIRLDPTERGGLELARDLIGLSGLALLCGAVLGARLAWVLPFAWAAGSYFAVTRTYATGSARATTGWLMFPGTFTATWWVAGALFVAGLAAFAWGGFIPRPRHHPLR